MSPWNQQNIKFFFTYCIIRGLVSNTNGLWSLDEIAWCLARVTITSPLSPGSFVSFISWTSHLPGEEIDQMFLYFKISKGIILFKWELHLILLARYINIPPIFFSKYNFSWETEKKNLHLFFIHDKQHQKHLAPKTWAGLTIIFGNLIICIIFLGSGKDPSRRQTSNGWKTVFPPQQHTHTKNPALKIRQPFAVSWLHPSIFIPWGILFPSPQTFLCLPLPTPR